MRNAIHQVFINLAPDAFGFCIIRLCLRAARMMIHRHGTADRLLNQFFCFMYAVGNLCNQNRLSVKPCKVNFFVSRDNNAFCLLYILCRQHVFSAVCPLGLHLDRDSHLLSFHVQALCRHKGVRNAGRAGRNGKHAIAFPRLLLCFFLIFPVQLIFLLINHPDKLFRCFRFDKRFLKFRVHQDCGQLCQRFQMHVCSGFRRCNHKNQICRLVIQRLIIHAVFHDHRRQSRMLYCRAF